ncbi:MAG: polysaccharide biosynthesis tyrosine autokinase [Cyclobacteriaceae bacterium]
MTAPQEPYRRESQDILNTFDPEKFLYLIKKKWWLLLVFFSVCIGVSYLIVRYTKPVYESKSILRLQFESEASSLGLGTNIEALDLNEISGEIELLKSKLFFSKVVDVIDMDVSYYYYGEFLVDERYRNSPFAVAFKIKNSAFYDKPIDVTLKNDQEFELSYDFEGEVIKTEHRFGEPINTDHFNFLIEKTNYFKGDEVLGKYYFTVNSREALINYLQQNVTVRPENLNAKTILISLQDFNKYKARDFVVAIDTLYLGYTKETKNTVLEQKIKFLDDQIKATEEKLESFEDYFESFIIKNRTTNLESDLSKTINLLNVLDSQRFNLRSRLIDIEVLEKQLLSDEPIMVSPLLLNQMPAMISDALKSYVEIQGEKQEKLESYNENTFVIGRLDNRLKNQRSNLFELVDEYKEALNTRLTELQVRKNKLEGNFVELPTMGTEYNKNQRLYSLQEDFLLSLRQSKMELEITKAGTVPKSVILSSASLESAPIKPQPLLIMGVGATLGIVLSIGFLLIAYLANNKITSLKELERLTDVPIIGSVPYYSKKKMEDSKLIVDADSKSSISESLRTIRTNMEFLQGSSSQKTVTITSTISGEGKTFVAVNMAAIVALSKNKVCVVDMDMRKPKVHLAFDSENGENGVSTLLIGKSKLEDCIRESKIKNLNYIVAGPIPPNPSELILNGKYEKLLGELKKKYDLVILDTPPIGLVTDAVQSMKKSDLQMYIMRADYSNRSFVKSLENLKKVNRFSNLTIVFNSMKSNGRGYGYGYGAGYAHGYYED